MSRLLQNNEYEIAVCGGGFAGIAAALSAAREGKKVVLFEKQYILGGLGTSGLVTVFLPVCDGFGKQVSFGIAEELLKLSILYGAEDKYPENWLDGKGTRTEKDSRYEVQYNPNVFAILAEQLLIKNGVDIFYGSYVVDAILNNNNKINGLYVENKTGKTLYNVKSVVDATGDCDIAKFANVPTATFKQGNVLASWYYFLNRKGYNLNMLGVADIPDEEKDELKIDNMVQRFSGVDGKELSEMTILSHQSLLNDWLKKRETDDKTIITSIATIPQVRMTRKLVGEYELSHKEEHVYFGDSIGMVSNWKKRGPVYEIPFRILYNNKIKNLITAGRCVSVNETLWDVMRVIPCCAVTGQAAGVAAAMTDDFSNFNVKQLQDRLKEQGVVLHEKDLR